MAIYLETNSLRKLTNYKCQQHVYTSIFSIFELLSGIKEEDFSIRQSCAKRIHKQKLKIKGPMIDKLFMSLIEVTDFNQYAYCMINDVFKKLIKSKSYDEFASTKLLLTDIHNQIELRNPIQWLSNWDSNISSITKNTPFLFEDEDKEYIKKVYKERGEKGLAEHFWEKYYESRIDLNKLNHAEAFIGEKETQNCKRKADELFSKYNYKLFIRAQALVFAKSYFINGNTQNRNNPSDLLHLLYLSEKDTIISNDKIYSTIKKGCEDLNLITMNNETSLSELLNKQTLPTSN